LLLGNGPFLSQIAKLLDFCQAVLSDKENKPWFYIKPLASPNFLFVYSSSVYITKTIFLSFSLYKCE